MKKQFEIIKNPRLYLLDLIKDLSVEQLNKIPAGFNNNVIWNLAHMIASQQGICYKRAGLDMIVSEDFLNSYKPDTKPSKVLTADEIAKIKELFISTIDQLVTDHANNLFANYTPWNNRYDVVINNFDEAISFLPFHDGLHVGYIMALKRAI
jgi:hypothetical protein